MRDIVNNAFNMLVNLMLKTSNDIMLGCGGARIQIIYSFLHGAGQRQRENEPTSLYRSDLEAYSAAVIES